MSIKETVILMPLRNYKILYTSSRDGVQPTSLTSTLHRFAPSQYSFTAGLGQRHTDSSSYYSRCGKLYRLKSNSTAQISDLRVYIWTTLHELLQGCWFSWLQAVTKHEAFSIAFQDTKPYSSA